MSQRVSVALRRKLYALAAECCEYCLFPASLAEFPHEPDHIIAVQHRGTTTLENLALACFPCNRHKGSNVGSYDEITGELTRLFHPRRDRWQDHFALHNGEILPITDIGRVTAHVLQFNTPNRIAERKLALTLQLISVLKDAADTI